MFTHTPTHGRGHFVQSMMGNCSAWWADANKNCEREIPFHFRFRLLLYVPFHLYLHILNMQKLICKMLTLTQERYKKHEKQTH